MPTPRNLSSRWLPALDALPAWFAIFTTSRSSGVRNRFCPLFNSHPFAIFVAGGCMHCSKATILLSIATTSINVEQEMTGSTGSNGGERRYCSTVPSPHPGKPCRCQHVRVSIGGSKVSSLRADANSSQSRASQDPALEPGKCKDVPSRDTHRIQPGAVLKRSIKNLVDVIQQPAMSTLS